MNLLLESVPKKYRLDARRSLEYLATPPRSSRTTSTRQSSIQTDARPVVSSSAPKHPRRQQDSKNASGSAKSAPRPPLQASQKARRRCRPARSSLGRQAEKYSYLRKVPPRFQCNPRRSLASAHSQNPFPKTMYWTGKGGIRFIRPIRWIVALLDDEVIPFEIAVFLRQ